MILENQDPSQLGLRFEGSLGLLKGALFGPKGTLTGSEIASEQHSSLFGRKLQGRTQKCVGNVSAKLQMAS